MCEKTDCELLELAAMAAGRDLTGWTWHDKIVPGFWKVSDEKNGSFEFWNPLDDDGDALRLAVKLEMNVEYCRRWSGARVITNPDNSLAREYSVANNNLDPCAATRRAIVRAASQISLGMENHNGMA